MTRLTTHEVLERCEITSSKTLTRWYRRELIPPPSIETHPSGRGKIAYWPGWIIHRIREVKERLARGESLDQIAKELGNEWDAERKRWLRRRPNLREAWARAARYMATRDFADQATVLIYDFLRSIGFQRPGMSDRIEQQFYEPEFWDEALKLMGQGHTPVIVIVGDKTRIIPDFLLTTIVSHPESQGQPMLVFPINDLFIEHFTGVDAAVTEPRKYLPARRVLERADKKVRVRKYTHQGRWGFSFED
jgi:hypothetical protein